MVATQSDDITTIDSITGITDDQLNNCSVVNHYWFVNPSIIKKLVDLCTNRTHVIDVGCSSSTFPIATHCVDFNDAITTIEMIKSENKYKLDIDFEIIPNADKYFGFCYCRHTLEDIQNPSFAFNEMVRCSSSGYIETPSPLIEVLKRVDAMTMDPKTPLNYSGYIHHRYFVWTNINTNTIYFLPKYPIIEHIHLSESLVKRLTFIANKYPVYWNNYYVWDETNRKPDIIVYKNGINFDVCKDYCNLLYEAIFRSFEHTNGFINTT